MKVLKERQKKGGGRKKKLMQMKSVHLAARFLFLSFLSIFGSQLHWKNSKCPTCPPMKQKRWHPCRPLSVQRTLGARGNKVTTNKKMSERVCAALQQNEAKQQAERRVKKELISWDLFTGHLKSWRNFEKYGVQTS